MRLDHRRSWKITVSAKISNFNIKFKATENYPSGYFHRLLRLLKLDKAFQNSKSESRILIQRPSLKSRILSFVRKHCGLRRSKRTFGFRFETPDLSPLVAEHQCRNTGGMESTCVVSLAVGLSYVVAQLGPKLKKNGDIISLSQSSITLLLLVCLVLVLKKWKQFRGRMLVIAAAIPVWLLVRAPNFDRLGKWLEASEKVSVG